MARKDLPLRESRLQKDNYYSTMGAFFFALQQERPVKTRSAFINRSKHIMLGEHIDFGRLREEIEHTAQLMYTEAELQWLWDQFGVDKPDGYITQEYLAYLR